jgi:hypothetical protein
MSPKVQAVPEPGPWTFCKSEDLKTARRVTGWRHCGDIISGGMCCCRNIAAHFAGAVGNLIRRAGRDRRQGCKSLPLLTKEHLYTKCVFAALQRAIRPINEYSAPKANRLAACNDGHRLERRPRCRRLIHRWRIRDSLLQQVRWPTPSDRCHSAVRRIGIALDLLGTRGSAAHDADPTRWRAPCFVDR